MLKSTIDEETEALEVKAQKEIPGGYIYIKYRFDPEWSRVYARINKNQLELYSKALDNKFDSVIHLYGANIEVVQECLSYI